MPGIISLQLYIPPLYNWSVDINVTEYSFGRIPFCIFVYNTCKQIGGFNNGCPFPPVFPLFKGDVITYPK
jgi:hypothetical protein